MLTLPNISFRLSKPILVALLVSACFIFILGQFTNIDLAIEDYYFDSNLHQFPWKNSWFAKNFMHGYAKYVISDIERLLVIIVALDFVVFWFKPLKFISPWLRIRLQFVAIATLLIQGVVALSKHFSSLHCPWGVDRYGGSAPFMRLLDHVPSAVKAGHCFPAGHATVALWLAALCVFWLPNSPKKALAVFTGGLAVGFVFGWVQQMRGAHFLFHTLWSVWFTAFIIAMMLGFAGNYLKLKT